MPNEKYVCTGIAAVSTADGKPYIDSQGDNFSTAELIKTAAAFLEKRHAGIQHLRNGDGSPVTIGKVIGSIVLTEAIQKALGISLGYEPWLVSLEIEDQRVVKLIKDGTLSGLSVAGRGIRTPFEIEEE
jgi:hypothetical protein